MKRIIQRITVLALVAVLAYGAALGIIHWRAKQMVNELVLQSSAYADVSYRDLEVDLSGVLVVKDVSLTPHGATEALQAERVVFAGPDAGFLLRVEAHLALASEGDVVVDDPDGIVVEATYVERAAVGTYLGATQRWVVEPLLAHLNEGVTDGRLFRYRMTGGRGEERKVDRL